MDQVYKLYGLPEGIVSDRDRIFTSAFWRELFKLSDTHLLMSSSYHPQTDGQMEWLNQCLENFLRYSVHSCPKQWSKWLSMAEFWYNTSYHTALGRTPFEALYGYAPKTFGITGASQCHSLDLEQWLLEKNLLKDLLHHQLHRAQQRMKFQADKNRSKREFEVGDQVYLKLQPFIRTSIVARGNSKLSFRYFGPYKILARVGAVAYRLDLPDDARIHLVIHVSQLNRHIPASIQVDTDLSQFLTKPDNSVNPLQFQSARMVRMGSSSILQVQIQREGLPPSLLTWEEVSDLRRRYPTSPAWGQAGFEEGANVRTLSKQQHKSDARPTIGGNTAIQIEGVKNG